MSAPLRPQNLGEILDRTLQIYRARFRAFVGIAAPPALAMLAIQVVFAFWLPAHLPAHPSPGLVVFWNYVVWIGLSQIAGFLNLLVSPAQVYLTSAATLGGGGSTRRALSFVAARWRAYFWTATLKLMVEVAIPEILVVVLLLGTILIAVLAGRLGGQAHAGQSAIMLVCALSAIPACALFFFLGSGLSLAIPAAALEGTSGMKALRRSWSLSKGSRVRIMTSWVLILIPAWALMYGASLTIRWLFILVCRGHASGMEAQHVYFAAVYGAVALMSALIGPLYPIALTLFYYDQRIRREGYDIERMMHAAGMTPTEPTPVALAAPVAASPCEEPLA